MPFQIAHNVCCCIKTAVTAPARADFNSVHYLGDTLAAVADVHDGFLGRAVFDDVERGVEAHDRRAADVFKVAVYSLLGGFFSDEHMIDMGAEKLLLEGIFVDVVQRRGDRVAGAGKTARGIPGVSVRSGGQTQQHAAALGIQSHRLYDQQLLYLFIVGIYAAAAAETQRGCRCQKYRKYPFHFCRLLSAVFSAGSRNLFIGLGRWTSSLHRAKGSPPLSGSV